MFFPVILSASQQDEESDPGPFVTTVALVVCVIAAFGGFYFAGLLTI